MSSGSWGASCQNVRAGGGGKTLLLPLALLPLAAAALAAIITANFTTAQAQSDGESTGRIVARLLADGRVEFGWQPSDGSRILPRQRYFPADATVDRWLRSSPVEVAGAELGRINARLLDDGRIEFAFTPTDGERIAPPARYFPADARVGRWLRSAEITIGSAVARYSAISAGWAHACAIRAGSGAIECWGLNGYYDYANRDETGNAPVVETGQTDAPAGSFSAIAAGDFHTCAIRTSGVIECWGSNEQGQTDAPEGSYTAIGSDAAHTCAIRAGSGAIECWGSPFVSPAGSFSAITVGRDHACARSDSGAIKCWGVNGVELSDTPEGSYNSISAGNKHTCAIRESGAIKCWGERSESVSQYGNEYSQTCVSRADGTVRVCDSNPERIDPPTTGRFTAVSVGAVSVCAIRASDGAIECWGKPIYGADNRASGLFTAIATGSFTAIDAGMQFACAIRDTGAIACFGYNADGQTAAPGSDETTSSPAAASYSAIAAGEAHTCAIRTDSAAIECWGANGFDTGEGYIETGQIDAPDGSYVAITAGFAHTCAIRRGDFDKIECWGRNDYGQADASVSSFRTVSAGGNHTCAIEVYFGEIVCWGWNDYGQTDAPDGSYVAIAAGYAHTCAIRASDSEIACWGRNDDGQTEVPTGRYIAVAAGYAHTCAIRASDSEIACWGSNEGTDVQWSRVPVGQSEPPPGKFRAIAAGEAHTCAIRDTEEIVCFGSNIGFNHIRGVNGGVGQSQPPPGKFRVIAAGSAHNCAIRSDSGAIECWGVSDHAPPN